MHPSIVKDKASSSPDLGLTVLVTFIDDGDPGMESLRQTRGENRQTGGGGGDGLEVTLFDQNGKKRVILIHSKNNKEIRP